VTTPYRDPNDQSARERRVGIYNRPRRNRQLLILIAAILAVLLVWLLL
jgi:hypothetical protein